MSKTHVKGQQVMVRLLITVKPSVKMAVCSLTGRMLVVSILSEISGHFPIQGKGWLVLIWYLTQ